MDKTFNIDGTEMRLKDLTLDEADRVNQLLSATEDGVIVSNEDSKEFLKIILEPVKVTNKKINFGACTESTAVEVLKSFLEKRIESGQDLRKYFSTLIKKQKKR